MDLRETRQITVRKFIARLALLSLLYFMCLSGWQVLVFQANQSAAEYIHPGALLFLVAAIALWLSGYFEIRTETEYGGRFLGYKAYLLFFLLAADGSGIRARGVRAVVCHEKRRVPHFTVWGVCRVRSRGRLSVEVSA